LKSPELNIIKNIRRLSQIHADKSGQIFLNHKNPRTLRKKPQKGAESAGKFRMVFKKLFVC